MVTGYFSSSQKQYKNKGTEIKVIVFETESEDIHIACNLPDVYGPLSKHLVSMVLHYIGDRVLSMESVSEHADMGDPDTLYINLRHFLLKFSLIFTCILFPW